MSVNKEVRLKPVNNKKDLEDNIDDVLNQLKDTLLNDMDMGRSMKLVYWINQWSGDYLQNEKTFDYMELMRYKRGSIVRANFGFKVGSEQGGLHYALVLDNKNHKSSKVLMVVPIGSLSKGKTPEDIHEDYEVFLGYGIFKDEIIYIKDKILELESKIEKLKENKKDYSKVLKRLQKTEKELISLNKGSVAQISQTCAMSKIRIYNPKHIGDRYGSFTCDEDKLKEIEEKYKKLYF